MSSITCRFIQINNNFSMPDIRYPMYVPTRFKKEKEFETKILILGGALTHGLQINIGFEF